MSRKELIRFSGQEILSKKHILDLPEGTFIVNEVYKTSLYSFEAVGTLEGKGATLCFVTNKQAWDEDVTAGKLLFSSWYAYEIC